jgi:2-phospho-L-lactate guanylyltransferase
LSDVLDALKKAGMAENCYVVSPDRQVLSLASRLGAKRIPEPRDNGVNSAVVRGMREASGFEDIMVVPSDLPLLKASDVRHLLTLRSRGPRTVIAPSLAFDGTNAYLFSRIDPITLSYDNDSFWRHLSDVAKKGLSVAVSSLPGVMFDVDSPEDFRMLARAQVNTPSAAFAREALR